MKICIVIEGRSGVGKTTLLYKLVENLSIHRIITTTTRPPREGERNGVDYHFIKCKDIGEEGYMFVDKIFGNYYGMSKNEYVQAKRSGKVVGVVLNISNSSLIYELFKKVILIRLETHDYKALTQMRTSINERMKKRKNYDSEYHFKPRAADVVYDINIDNLSKTEVFSRVFETISGELI